jgi:hypothetical protein
LEIPSDARYAESMIEDDTCYEDDMQLVRHFVFLVLIVCSFMVVSHKIHFCSWCYYLFFKSSVSQSLAMSLWDLVGRSGGLYIEISFIEITLRRGQAFFAFCIFVLDYRGVIKPSIKWRVQTNLL